MLAATKAVQMQQQTGHELKQHAAGLPPGSVLYAGTLVPCHMPEALQAPVATSMQACSCAKGCPSSVTSCAKGMQALHEPMAKPACSAAAKGIAAPNVQQDPVTLSCMASTMRSMHLSIPGCALTQSLQLLKQLPGGSKLHVPPCRWFESAQHAGLALQLGQS